VSLSARLEETRPPCPPTPPESPYRRARHRCLRSADTCLFMVVAADNHGSVAPVIALPAIVPPRGTSAPDAAIAGRRTELSTPTSSRDLGGRCLSRGGRPRTTIPVIASGTGNPAGCSIIGLQALPPSLLWSAAGRGPRTRFWPPTTGVLVGRPGPSGRRRARRRPPLTLWTLRAERSSRPNRPAEPAGHWFRGHQAGAPPGVSRR